MSGNMVSSLDPLFLFACRALWLRQGDAGARRALVAASDAANAATRCVARALLQDAERRLASPDWATSSDQHSKEGP